MKEDRVIKDWLEKELKSEEKDQMEKYIAFTEKLEVPSKTNKNTAWEALISNIDETPSGNSKILRQDKSKRKNLILWTVSAAVLFFVAYFSFVTESKTITYKTPIGETLTFNLPDNSVVTLNAGSSATFNEKNWSTNRNIYLSGEAFFEVVAGKEFTVNGTNGNVKVLGTSFNVFDRSNEFITSVFTGRVMVTAGEKTMELYAGDEVRLKKDRLELFKFNPAQTATWRTGSFYYDGEPLSKVIEELERQFGITISMKTDISERFYSGYFNKNNLTEALQLVFVPMGLSIETNEKQVTIQ